jgi:CRP-like cAMP-binding protein
MPLPPGSRGITAGKSVGSGSRSRKQQRQQQHAQFLDRLVASRFRPKHDISRVLRREEEARAAERLHLQPPAYYLTGVRKGVYFRIKLPPQEQSRLVRLALPTLPQIPASPLAVQPHAFNRIPTAAATTAASEPSSSAAAAHHHHHHAHPPTVVAAGGGVREGAVSCNPLATSALAAAGAARRREDWNDFWWRLQEWWKENWTIIVLNIGSICSLIGFTRSDVLELRCFSMMGSLSAIVYKGFHKPLQWSPVLWSATFAVVNGVKIVQILLERNSTVNMTQAQQGIYDQFFMPHGITPKQFERIYNKAEIIHIAKDECLIRKGDRLEYVYLIVDGWTRANILGRYLTAGSFQPPPDTSSSSSSTNKHSSSGAWIGEIAFLEGYWNKEHAGLKRKISEEKNKKASCRSKEDRAEQELTSMAANLNKSDKYPSDAVVKKQQRISPKSTKAKAVKGDAYNNNGLGALYTIVAKEETTILRWTHADMERLLESSPDTRAGLTRAMTAAMAAKVIQFTLSRSSALPTSWNAWLDDWKHTTTQPPVAAAVSNDYYSPFHVRGGDAAGKTAFSSKHDVDATTATLSNDNDERGQDVTSNKKSTAKTILSNEELA